MKPSAVAFTPGASAYTSPTKVVNVIVQTAFRVIYRNGNGVNLSVGNHRLDAALAGVPAQGFTGVAGHQSLGRTALAHQSGGARHCRGVEPAGDIGGVAAVHQPFIPRAGSCHEVNTSKDS